MACYCYHCKKEIFFDDEFVSPSGKKIPLTKFNGEYHKHRCPENPYNKETRRDYAYQQENNPKTDEDKQREEQELKERHRRWKEEQAKHEDPRKKYYDPDRYDLPAELDSILRDKKTVDEGHVISEIAFKIWGPREDLTHAQASSQEKKLARIMGQIRIEAYQNYREQGIMPDFLPFAQPMLGQRHVWKYFNAVDFLMNQAKLHQSRSEGLQHVADLLRRMCEAGEDDDDME